MEDKSWYGVKRHEKLRKDARTCDKPLRKLGNTFKVVAEINFLWSTEDKVWWGVIKRDKRWQDVITL